MGTDELPPVRQWDAETAYEQIRSEIAVIQRVCGLQTIRLPMMKRVKIGEREEWRPHLGKDGTAQFLQEEVYSPRWLYLYETTGEDMAEVLYANLTTAVESLSLFPGLRSAVDTVRVRLCQPPRFDGLRNAIERMIVECDKLRDEATWEPIDGVSLAKRASGRPEHERDRKKFEAALKWINRESSKRKRNGDIVVRDVPKDPSNPSGSTRREYRSGFVREVMEKYAYLRQHSLASNLPATP